MRKGEKLFLILFLLFIIFMPPNLHAKKKMYLKLSFGLSKGGFIEDTLLSPSEFSEYVAVSHQTHSNIGLDVYVEFIYHLNPYLSLSLGYGYISKKLIGKTSDYDRLDSGQIFTVYPEFYAEVTPFCGALSLSFPLSSSIQINLYGGAGFYLMNCEGKSTWEIGNYDRTTFNFDGSSSQIGYHFGGGFDKEIAMNFLLTIDAEYKIVNFKDIESVELSGDYQTSEYLQWFMSETVTVFNYHISEAGLTGLTIRVGIKFKF
jgi:hypothetical protein